jgi:hypothetical protein
MSTSTVKEKDTRVPEGYVAIPVQQSEQSSAVKICVLVRQTPEPAAGSFVLLRDQHDARVYLGALVDAGGRVREWLELWVQNVDGLDASLPAHRESFSNFSLDARWAERAEAFRELAGPRFLRTGWETAHPLPTFLDLSQAAPVHPGTAENGGPWELCRDDKLLQAAGLPAYSTSLFRYLYQPGAAAGAPVVSVTAGAPESATTRPLAQVMTGVEHHLSFNPQGGLIMAVSLAPLAFEDYVDLLGGKAWAGIEHGKKRVQLDGSYQGLSEWDDAQQDNAHLFLGARGKAGRFLETYHLKLQLLAEVFRQVRAFVQRQQLPFLNLSAESFRVGLGELGGGLPLLWTSRCSLVKPGTACALPVETSDFRYFIRARTAAASIYLP